MRAVALIPAFNEARTIAAVVEGVGAAGGGYRQKRRGFVRQMLQVGIEQQHVRERALEHAREARSYRVPLPHIGGVGRDFRSRFTRPISGAVGRAVVDDDHVVDSGAQAFDDGRNRSRFVERRDQRDGTHGHRRRPVSSSAGSTSTDAAASVTTLTAETIPIERSGGYDDHMSVP